MKLVAMMMVAPVERDRYLLPCVRNLLSFCDEVVMLLDGWQMNAVDTYGWQGRVSFRQAGAPFYEHEGRARQELLDYTLEHRPTHVLAIDADEFVTDGPLLRKTLERAPLAQVCWTLCMQEVWAADEKGMHVRQDGGWNEHPIPSVFSVNRLRPPLRIADKKLASGRVPEEVRRLARTPICAGILHFGWANVPERAARYQRYVEHDGGAFHASAHLESILWDDSRVKSTHRTWPEALKPQKQAILSHAGVT